MNFLFIDTGSQRSPLITVSARLEFACKLWLFKRFCERAGRICARVRRPAGEKPRGGVLGPTAVSTICMAVASAHVDPFRTLRPEDTYHANEADLAVLCTDCLHGRVPNNH